LTSPAEGVTYNQMVVETFEHEKQTDRLFFVLSDATRRDIVTQTLDRERSVSELGRLYPISLTAVQKHVEVLVGAGLVSKHRSGREQLVRGEVDQLRRAHEEPIMLPTPRDDRLAAACSLASEALGRPVSLADLARAVNVGERTLSRLFRREFGMTYPQWRTRVRVFEAMILLAGGASVTETASRCGWATTSSFVDTFHRMMGRTPGSYRGGRRP